MTLIVEDGTGLPGSNCYISEAELDAYALLRNIDLAAYTTAQKEAAIFISANDFIDAMHEFKGDKIDAGQGMALYTDLVTFDAASKDIKNVNACTAILQLQGKLFVETSVDDKYGDIKSQMDKLDVLETKTEYAEGTAITGGTFDTTIADKLLKPYLAAGSGGVQLRRC
jgi:hypothetical protein